jgi:galactokinase
LIGDHTDYNGLPVFPMALQRDITILFRQRDDATVRIANVDSRFPPYSFELDEEIEASVQGDWSNYAKAAGQALSRSHGPLRGFDGVFSGNIPVAAGLSSSSALLVAVATALVDVNSVSIKPLQLMSLMARAEHYTGTEGGGMDQAICLGGAANAAIKIEFDPLRLTPVPVPKKWSFIIAFSGLRAEKSGDAREAYNSRPRECKAALERLSPNVTLSGSYRELIANARTDELLSTARDVLDELLFRRFRHVVTEASRVDEAGRAMEQGDIQKFGRLMIESHRSLREDYEVSCAELDELVEAALNGGAAGARLTGAGFGGCIVALCSSAQTPDLISSITENYYQRRGRTESLADDVLVAEPSPGASVTPFRLTPYMAQ